MGIVIALLFLLLPLAEIATFVLVGREVGVGTTLMLVLASMFAGIVLIVGSGSHVIGRSEHILGHSLHPDQRVMS